MDIWVIMVYYISKKHILITREIIGRVNVRVCVTIRG